MSILTSKIFWGLKFLAKVFKLLGLIPGTLLFSGSFLEHVRELKFAYSLCLLGAHGLHTTSLLREQLLQKYLHCNLMRLTTHS